MDFDSGRQVSPNVESASGAGSPDLRSYEQLKFELADLIREANSRASELKNEDLQRKLRGLLKRVAEDRFYLTFAGQFSRGKTTLINAMLGMDRLPTGIVPITSVITAVSYDTHERVVLHFEGSHLTQEISLNELPEWITEQGNPGNRERVEIAEVQLPADILRRGAFLVDTPGLGSAVIENTRTTNEFLPQIDALLLVTSFEFPLSAEEVSFFRAARSQRCKLFVVINKLDLCSTDERDQVLGFIQSRVAEESGDREVQIFPLSATLALRAQLARDEEGLERSGLANLERSLIQYLVTEKSRDFVRRLCDRLKTVLAEFDNSDSSALRIRLEAIKTEAANTDESSFRSPEGPQSRASLTIPPAVTITPCVICSQIAQSVHDFMRHFQYDVACRVETQIEHAAASGFCALHTWQYFRLASPQGMAAGYAKTVSLVARSLREIATNLRVQDKAVHAFDEILPSRQKCRACQRADLAESSAIQTLLHELQDRQHNQPGSLPCLCLTHLAIVAGAIENSDLAAELTENQASALDHLGENLQRFALQHGGSHWEHVTDEEQRSPELSLNLLVGPGTIRVSKRRPT